MSESAGRSVKMSKESEQCQLIVRASLQSFHGRKSYGMGITKLKPSLVMIVVGRPESLYSTNEHHDPEPSHHGAIPANGNVMLSRDNAVVIVPTWLPSSLDVIGDQVSTCAISRMKTCAADAQQLYISS
jgi:hypothetical protein